MNMNFDVISVTNNYIAGAQQQIVVPDLFSTRGLMRAASQVTAEYTLIVTSSDPVTVSSDSVSRMVVLAKRTGAALLYSDYHEIKSGFRYPHMLIIYQAGSLRDDFDFGPMYVVKTSLLKIAAESMETSYDFAALYDLRLRLSRMGNIFHLPEYMYTKQESDLRTSGAKQFDYVDPRNRAVQIEMEKVCTEHLKTIGAYIEPGSVKTCSYEGDYPVEVSVVIPVYNRKTTIADAVGSALAQTADFDFNIIVVDNHSTDGTTTVVSELAAVSDKVIHLVPDRQDLGIGGCWNEAVSHPMCGRFVVQLDSDDLYLDDTTLQKVVDKFRAENSAMVIGSYNMVDFNLEPLPPGLIDHKEWTDENGRNNALRVNGLGAPRAFVTNLLREIKLPNVSYGEDYAIGLRLSREYHIGRIFEPIYLCRRWRGNSDAQLDQLHVNGNNYYKDNVRTVELCCRVMREH